MTYRLELGSLKVFTATWKPGGLCQWKGPMPIVNNTPGRRGKQTFSKLLLWAGILYLNFSTTLPDRHSYSHFTDEDAEAQRC